MELKQQLLNYHLTLLQDKIDVYNDMISALATDAQNDAKSSAGDKHETALSMMHLEQEKISAKLHDALTLKQKLRAINIEKVSVKVGLGSLIKTDKLWVWISEALPKVEISAITVFSVSLQSPLGSGLLGKEVGQEVSVNNSKFKILEIL